MEKLSSITSSITNSFLKRSSSSKSSDKVVNNQSNPFGVSFNGKMISADVFEKSSSISSGSTIAGKIVGKSMLLSSAVVGSISDMASSISSRLNSVANFGRRIKSNLTSFWEKAKNTDITFDMLNLRNLVKSNVSEIRESLSKRPVSELESMLKESIGKLESEEVTGSSLSQESVVA